MPCKMLDFLLDLNCFFFLRHLNERKQKMKEKKKSSEENTSFDSMKGICNLVRNKDYYCF